MLKNCELFISEYYVFGCRGLQEFSLGTVSCLGDAIEVCNTSSGYESFNLYGKLSKKDSLLFIGCYCVEYGLI